MKLYKLTDEKAQTHYGKAQWGEDVTNEVKARPSDPQLCTSDVIHAYPSAALALLMNPVHAAYEPLRLWEAEGEPVVTKPDKVGCFELTTIRELAVPLWYADETKRKRVAVRFAVLSAQAVLEVFEKARPDDKRPRLAIEAAERYFDAAYAAAYTADAAAAYVAYAANADAAHAAAYAAYAAYAAAYAANAARATAYAAAAAAAYAANANAAANDLDLVAFAEQAVAGEDKA